MFFKSIDNVENEKSLRLAKKEKILKFGVRMLDDACSGILRNDLILIGAASGAGKTELCTQIALNNVRNSKRVHFIALEAEEFEIERRILYSLIANKWYADKSPDAFDLRENKLPRFSFKGWCLGEFKGHIEQFESEAEQEFKKQFNGLFTYYKRDRFKVDNLIETVLYAAASETDLVIIDHVHYFDFETDNENREIKEIAKMARSLALESGKPIILVGHLRKRDRNNDDLVPGLEEFHGSSDLYKIATRVITLAPGPKAGRGYHTYLRIPKDRLDGGNARFIGQIKFNPAENCYDQEYSLGKSGSTKQDGFTELDEHSLPDWARRSSACRNGSANLNPNQNTLGSNKTGGRASGLFSSIPNHYGKQI